MHNDFCQFLQQRGALPEEVVARIQRRAAVSRAPIGKLIIERGLMTSPQVMEVLRMQAQEPGMRFGELAVRAGFLSAAELEITLQIQAARRRHPAEVLRSEGLIPEGEFWLHLMEYLSDLERSIREEP